MYPTILNRQIQGGALLPVFVDNILVDQETQAWVFLPWIHHIIHVGKMFIASHYFGSIANGSSIQMLIRTGARESHLVFAGSAGGDALIRFYEGVTYTNPGTNLAEINMKRTSANIASIDVKYTPAGIAGGVLLFENLEPGGAGGNATGTTSVLREESEFELEENETYLVDLENISGQAKPMSGVVQWYEI